MAGTEQVDQLTEPIFSFFFSLQESWEFEV